MKRVYWLAFLPPALGLSGCVSLPAYYSAMTSRPASVQAEQTCRQAAGGMRSGDVDALPPNPSAPAEGGAFLGNSLRHALEFRDAYNYCMERHGYVRHD